VILREMDRGAGHKIRKTCDSTTTIASEQVTPDNSDTMDGIAESIAVAAGFALSDSPARGELSIARRFRTGPSMDHSGPLPIAANPSSAMVAKSEPRQSDHLRVWLGRGHGKYRRVGPARLQRCGSGTHTFVVLSPMMRPVRFDWVVTFRAKLEIPTGRCSLTAWTVRMHILDAEDVVRLLRSEVSRLFTGTRHRFRNSFAAREDLSLPLFAVLDRNKLEAPVHYEHSSVLCHYLSGPDGYAWATPLRASCRPSGIMRMPPFKLLNGFWTFLDSS
jgi:hypothetical protein